MKTRKLPLIVLMLIVSGQLANSADPTVVSAQQRRIQVIKNVAPSVVAVFGRGNLGGGSGVLISKDGYALTNFHVIANTGAFMKCGLNDGVLYDAVKVGIDPTGDVAIIKLLGRDDFPVAKLGDSDQVKMGDWAYAMGNPFLLATDFQPTVTYGIVSGTHRYQPPAGNDFLEYTDCIQVDSSINPGNSGGPLFSDAGELIGINGRGSFEKRGRVNSGAGYAISINQIKFFMDHLLSGRIVDHATLGASVATDIDGRVLVGNILEQSEAYRRGLRIDDEVVSFAGRPIRSVNQFKNILGIYPKGWKLPLVFRHEEERQEVFVRLRGLHRQSQLKPTPNRRPGRPQPKPKDNKKPDDTTNPHAESGPPEKYKHLFEAKPGFTNYYFNKLQQDKLLNGLKPLGDFSAVSGTWKISGKRSADKAEFELTVSTKGVGIRVGDDYAVHPLNGDPFEDSPAGSGGLLAAMHHWKLFMTKGRDAFTEFYYLGSEPMDGQSPFVHVLISELTGLESRWYFHHKTGEFLGFDTQLIEDVDACEVRFRGKKSFGDKRLPAQLHVISGGQTFATLELEAATLSPTKK